MSAATAPTNARAGFAHVVATALKLAFRSARGVLVGLLAVALVTAAAPVAATWLVKDVLDVLATEPTVRAIAQPACALAAISAVMAVTPQISGYLRARLTRATGLRAQARLHASVDTFTGLRRFEDPAFLDQLRLAQQAGGLAPSQVVEGAAGIVRSIVLLAGFIGSLALLHPLLAVVVTASGVPVLWAEVALSRRRARALWDISPTERREIFYATLLTSVEAAKEIRLYGVGAFLRERMLGERRTADAQRELLDRRELRVQSCLQITSALLAGAALLWAARAAAQGSMTVGDVSMLLTAVPAVQSGIGGLAGEVGQTHHSLTLFRHYVTVVGLDPDLPAPSHPRPAAPLADAIEFQDVWFRYGEGLPWILRGVTLRLERGSAVALVGVNGSGKSTLVKLLCRFYDPTRGRILWDGTDLRDIPAAELRTRIAATFQDPMRYELPALENIALGELSALRDPGRCEEAARFAGVHDDIARLPHGYRTLLSRTFRTAEEHGPHAPADTSEAEGKRTVADTAEAEGKRTVTDTAEAEGTHGPGGRPLAGPSPAEPPSGEQSSGVQLSGGQWQRMGLARSFLRQDADVLILDEPSSGLDPLAEYEIHTRLRQHRTGRTSLLISHRLGTVKDADAIAVLENGRITELGDHHQLLARRGTYHRLFTLQSRGYVEEHPAPEATTAVTPAAPGAPATTSTAERDGAPPLAARAGS
ncbi:ABC transporter ATP-binding protein [Streptomyces sp. NPDC047987]|uniref:ABC transporter ATP-binding protein n=1 Tax=unclassified Streptomyces TaxID=2593676 RepID=UPI003432AE32